MAESNKLKLNFIKVFNQTKKIHLTSEAKIAESITDQLLGLINPRNPRTMVFITRLGIHTFFLNKPIGLLVLNNENTVVQKTIIKPWRIFVWNPNYSVVIEMPVSLVQLVKVGDVIEFKKATTKTIHQ